MKYKLVLILLSSLILSNTSFSTEKVIKNAVISCIRVVEGDMDFNDIQPELFFWNESASKSFTKFVNSGYKLKKSIHSSHLCGGYTPNIEVTSRDRDFVMEAINNYELYPEDGLKIWETKLVLTK